MDIRYCIFTEGMRFDFEFYSEALAFWYDLDIPPAILQVAM